AAAAGTSRSRPRTASAPPSPSDRPGGARTAGARAAPSRGSRSACRSPPRAARVFCGLRRARRVLDPGCPVGPATGGGLPRRARGGRAPGLRRDETRAGGRERLPARTRAARGGVVRREPILARAPEALLAAADPQLARPARLPARDASGETILA